ncbi:MULTISPECIES: hypothetical protein [Stenotrophomonas]|uniref:hypothetical protein n=1 Tax=Stenotrophomonas TaxID=40323 RepID=UPI0021CA9E37|nr:MULTISPECIES: hypothetical protein [Stenotrophomonas]MCU1136937.1 hypothetical protein [Stenotrophomonas maltophilia]MEC4339739.1 hypothetical protein [Stenotrophomonas pavanii]
MSIYTEADEACRGDALVALANIRYQMVMGESEGLIDYYAQAAVNCGLSRPDVNQYIARSRTCFDKPAYLFPLYSATQAYLSGGESAEGYAAFIDASFIDHATIH